MASLWCRGNILVFVAVFLPEFVSGQITFSKAYDFGTLTLCQSVQEIEGGYLLSAYSLHNPGGIRKLNLGRLDEAGDTLSVKTYGNSNEQYRYYKTQGVVSNGLLLNDSIWLTAWTKSVNQVEKVCLVWSNLNGDTLFSSDFESPFSNEYNYFRPSNFDIDESGNIYLSVIPISFDIHPDILVFKLNSDGEIIWTYHPQLSGYQFNYCVRSNQDGVIMDEVGLVDGIWKINKRNSPTSTEWSTDISVDNTFNGIREFVIEESGIVFCATYPWGIQVLPAAMKIDYSGQTLWFFGAEGIPQELSVNHCGQIEKTQDGGYLLGAEERIYNPPNPEINGSFNDYVRLIKLDADGNHQWDRYYHYIVSTQETHQLADLRATSDGGYVFCGHVTDSDFENIGSNVAIQWGWVVKVDACGCLVPGCDPDCIYPGVEETTIPTDKPQYFVCGPNPAADFLNIYMRQAPEGATLRIHDMTGKELRSFAAGHAGLTHMASVRGWSAGVYVVSLEKGGEVLQSLKVVVK